MRYREKKSVSSTGERSHAVYIDAKGTVSGGIGHDEFDAHRSSAAKFPRTYVYSNSEPLRRICGNRDAAGIEEWPHNALRHSFASYHLARFNDAAAPRRT